VQPLSSIQRQWRANAAGSMAPLARKLVVRAGRTPVQVIFMKKELATKSSKGAKSEERFCEFCAFCGHSI
jgi:hypothetical protein